MLFQHQWASLGAQKAAEGEDVVGMCWGLGASSAKGLAAQDTSRKPRGKHGPDCARSNLDPPNPRPCAHTSRRPFRATQAFTRNANGVEGALNGLWMDVFLHDRSRLLCDDVLPQEATESPCLWLCGGSPSPPRFCPVATAAWIGVRRSYFHCSSGWWSPWPVAGTFSVLWQLDTDGEPSCPFGPWSGACSPTCHWWVLKTGFGINEKLIRFENVGLNQNKHHLHGSKRMTISARNKGTSPPVFSLNG